MKLKDIKKVLEWVIIISTIITSMAGIMLIAENALTPRDAATAVGIVILLNVISILVQEIRYKEEQEEEEIKNDNK